MSWDAVGCPGRGRPSEERVIGKHRPIKETQGTEEHRVIEKTIPPRIKADGRGSPLRSLIKMRAVTAPWDYNLRLSHHYQPGVRHD